MAEHVGIKNYQSFLLQVRMLLNLAYPPNSMFQFVILALFPVRNLTLIITYKCNPCTFPKEFKNISRVVIILFIFVILSPFPGEEYSQRRWNFLPPGAQIPANNSMKYPTPVGSEYHSITSGDKKLSKYSCAPIIITGGSNGSKKFFFVGIHNDAPQVAGLRRPWQYEDLVWGMFMAK